MFSLQQGSSRVVANSLRRMRQKTPLLSAFNQPTEQPTSYPSSAMTTLGHSLLLQRSFSTYPTNFAGQEDAIDIKSMTDEQLADNSTIPGWEFVHCPPREVPRGALVGTVVSDKMQKTVNVAVDRYQIVKKYKVRRRYTRKFMAHDEGEVACMGDVVMIVPCHRISKHKHFMLREIIKAKEQL